MTERRVIAGALVLAVWLTLPGLLLADQVANFSTGEVQTPSYEQLSFWVHDNGKKEISYAYGKDGKEMKLLYLGAGTEDGVAVFSVKFPNGFVLKIVPNEKTLSVLGEGRKYAKEFKWEYEGPIDGKGTYCDVCVDEAEALPFVKEKFLE